MGSDFVSIRGTASREPARAPVDARAATSTGAKRFSFETTPIHGWACRKPPRDAARSVAQALPKGKGAATPAPGASIALNPCREHGAQHWSVSLRRGRWSEHHGLLGHHLRLRGQENVPVRRRSWALAGNRHRVLDLQTMQWSSLYPTTPRSEMTLSNGDSDLGRWISTNQPYARHSYNMTVVAGRRFYLFHTLWAGRPPGGAESAVRRPRLLVRLRRQGLEVQSDFERANALGLLSNS